MRGRIVALQILVLQYPNDDGPEHMTVRKKKRIEWNAVKW